MSLKHVAEQLMNSDDSVVNMGLDDTTKAGGQKRYDIKTDHITITGVSQSRKTFTTGYTENISHTGVDGAITYTHKLNCFAILAGYGNRYALRLFSI